MPPFGKRWFRVLKDLDDPIAQLRLHWIMLNIREDERLGFERKREEIEYGGFFANPEVYAQLKGISKSEGFTIVQDTSEYDRKLHAGYRGEVEAGRREDVAELVRTKRDAMAKRSSESRTATSIPSDLDTDDLIVEG